MKTAHDRLRKIFSTLDKRVKEINRRHLKEELRPVLKSEVKLLGQMSLLVDERVSAILSLAQTADMDALLKMDHIVKLELKKILSKEGLVYDEDSPLIWIPKDSKFNGLFEFDHVKVTSIDPESALVSKAVKAAKKNKQIVREAIASDCFPNLVERILTNGGNLEDFT
jgi:hypothetical protein